MWFNRFGNLKKYSALVCFMSCIVFRTYSQKVGSYLQISSVNDSITWLIPENKKIKAYVRKDVFKKMGIPGKLIGDFIIISDSVIEVQKKTSNWSDTDSVTTTVSQSWIVNLKDLYVIKSMGKSFHISKGCNYSITSSSEVNDSIRIFKRGIDRLKKGKHSLEINPTLVLFGPRRGIVSHFKSQGYGIDIPKYDFWGINLHTEKYPKSNYIGNGFGIDYGYFVTDVSSIGITCGYTNLSRVRGHNQDGNFIRLKFSQAYFIPKFRVENQATYDLSVGVGLALNMSNEDKNSNDIIGSKRDKYYHYAPAFYAEFNYIVDPPKIPLYFKFGCTGLFSTPTEIGEFNLGYDGVDLDTFQSKKISFGFLRLQIKIGMRL